MATASETDLLGTTQWSRSSFSKSFKRRGRKNKNADTNSIASSGGGGGLDASPVIDSPFLRRNSTDSSRKLSLRLGARRRSKIGLGRTESGSSEKLSRTTTDEPAAAEEDSSNYYTEEEEER
jgi:hypothetical protein